MYVPPSHNSTMRLRCMIYTVVYNFLYMVNNGCPIPAEGMFDLPPPQNGEQACFAPLVLPIMAKYHWGFGGASWFYCRYFFLHIRGWEPPLNI
jgi:hypothetical protein